MSDDQIATISLATEALRRYADIGSISCAEARAHGTAPAERGHPAYTICEIRTETAWCVRSEQIGQSPRTDYLLML